MKNTRVTRESKGKRADIPRDTPSKLAAPQEVEAQRRRVFDEQEGPKGLARAIRVLQEDRDRPAFRDVLEELNRLFRAKEIETEQ